MYKLGFYIAFCHFTKKLEMKFLERKRPFSIRILKWRPFLLLRRLWYHLSKIWYIPAHRDYRLSFSQFEFCLVHLQWVWLTSRATKTVFQLESFKAYFRQRAKFGHLANLGSTRRYSKLWPWFESRNKFTSSLFNPMPDEFNFFTNIRGHYCPHKL